MKKIFWGLILLLLTFDIDLGGGHVLTLLPDFIGFIVIFLGIHEMLDWGINFKRAQIAAVAMIAYSAVTFTTNLFALESGMLGTITDVLFTLMTLYMYFEIVEGIGSIEKITGENLNYERTKKTLKIYMVLVIFAYVVLIPAVSLFASSVLVGMLGLLVLIIAAFVFYIIFITHIYKISKLYAEYMAKKNEAVSIAEDDSNSI